MNSVAAVMSSAVSGGMMKGYLKCPFAHSGNVSLALLGNGEAFS